MEPEVEVVPELRLRGFSGDGHSPEIYNVATGEALTTSRWEGRSHWGLGQGCQADFRLLVAVWDGREVVATLADYGEDAVLGGWTSKVVTLESYKAVEDYLYEKYGPPSW